MLPGFTGGGVAGRGGPLMPHAAVTRSTRASLELDAKVASDRLRISQALIDRQGVSQPAQREEDAVLHAQEESVRGDVLRARVDLDTEVGVRAKRVAGGRRRRRVDGTGVDDGSVEGEPVGDGVAGRGPDVDGVGDAVEELPPKDEVDAVI